MRLTLTVEPDEGDYWLDTVRAVAPLCNQVSCVRVFAEHHTDRQIANRLRAMGFEVEELDGERDESPVAGLPSAGAVAHSATVANQSATVASGTATVADAFRP